MLPARAEGTRAEYLTTCPVRSVGDQL